MRYHVCFEDMIILHFLLLTNLFRSYSGFTCTSTLCSDTVFILIRVYRCVPVSTMLVVKFYPYPNFPNQLLSALIYIRLTVN